MEKNNYLIKGRNYTDKQLAFLDKYQETFDISLSAAYAAYANKAQVTATLHREILTITENALALQAGKAVDTIVQALDANGTPQLRERLDAAKTILDRIGIVKKEKIEVEANVEGGIFILPRKDT